MEMPDEQNHVGLRGRVLRDHAHHFPDQITATHERERTGAIMSRILRGVPPIALQPIDTSDDASDLKTLDICAKCPLRPVNCQPMSRCTLVRGLVLDMIHERMRSLQDSLPRGRQADYLCGYQQGVLMGLNVICDMQSGKLEEVMARAAGEQQHG
jgi:hypothetical protein